MAQCSASLTEKTVKSLRGKKFEIDFRPNYIYILGYKIYIVFCFMPYLKSYELTYTKF